MTKRALLNRRTTLAGLAATQGVALGLSRAAAADEKPIKIGMAIAQTGGIAAGGKSSLLGMEIWRDDVNAKGGLLGRKVELVVYDDKSSATETPTIYAKLIDIDKVDILFGPYGTVPTAPIMPMVKQRGMLLMGNFAYEANQSVKHDMWFNIAPWGPPDALARGFIELGVKQGTKTIAVLAADQEFAQSLSKIGKAVAAEHKLSLVYDQSYPPTTVEFTSMVRAVKAARPDMVFVCSYPPDSVGILRAVNEVGVGPGVMLFGGGMVGPQYGAIMQQLGSQLNGLVNYATLVPEKTQEFNGTREFLDRYAKRAIEAKVDPLGFYLAPFGYALGEIVANAVTTTKGLDQKKLASYMRETEHSTVVGKFRFGSAGEWKDSGIVQVQYRGLVDKNIEQFRQPGKQVILSPVRLKSGELIAPFEKARG